MDCFAIARNDELKTNFLNSLLNHLKNMSKKKVIIWVFICAIIYFLFNKDIVNVTLYAIVTLSLSLYFFPIKPVLEICKQKDNTPQTIILILLSNFVLSAALSLTVIRAYMPENKIIEMVSGLFYIFNGLLAYYNLFIKDDMNAAILHFMISLCFLKY